MAEQGTSSHKDAKKPPGDPYSQDNGGLTTTNSTTSTNAASADLQPIHSFNTNGSEVDASTNSKSKPVALGETDTKVFASAGDTPSKRDDVAPTDSNANLNPNRVTFADPTFEAAHVDRNIEPVLPDGEDDPEVEKTNQENQGAAIGVGPKKKKKRKPKSQRGLVRTLMALRKYVGFN